MIKNEKDVSFKITPWEVEGKVNYDRLVKEFGTQYITENLKKRFLKYANALHVLLRRNVFFSHRDLDKVLDDYDKGKGFFLYTGRGPSGKMHIGHLLPILFTKWLQDIFDVNVYIEITDDEKYVYSKDAKWKDIEKYADENILDIAAVGFDPNKTFIFKDSEYIKHLYPLALKVSKHINLSMARAVFGFDTTTNIGLIFYPSLQIVPTFFERKRCLIPCAIDQDPYWRIQRDIAEKFGYHKASIIHSIFLPPLTGIDSKMSTSKPEGAIFLDDAPDDVERKIMRYAFSGGQPTIELHRRYGGNPDIDVSYQWLYIFFEEDDDKILEIREKYSKGELLTGELKKYLIEKINVFLENHRNKREKIRDKVDKYLYDGKLAKKMWEISFEDIFTER